MVTQAAEGLAALHAVGIVHRDIKPANLLLASDSSGARRLMVADLGVAKAITPDSGVTRSVGTPSYMAPEQMDDAAVIDARADVYALGAVAWALLTGQPPRARRFPGERPAPVTTLRAVPPAVDQVVIRAMEPDPDHRWPDVRSFARALTDACRGVAPPPAPAPTTQPAAAPPASGAPAAPARDGGRHRPGTAVLASVAALAVVLAVALGVVLLRGGAGGSDDYKDAFKEAGLDYVSALQDRRCADAAPYDPDLTDPEDVCDPDKNSHLELAKCLDVDGPVRVDMIGENRARVVFVDQGYVEMIRGEDTLFRAGFMVGSC
ncbi:serine/threonine-protein kinase [Nocardioides sp. MAHUQ-72]|uniref:serine/threonine-protein kinase n=1 Tax=unclassified Nocardioides TaxID=2615069 RepID=UPI00360C721A